MPKRRKKCPFDMDYSLKETIRDTSELTMGAGTLMLGFGALNTISGLVKKP